MNGTLGNFLLNIAVMEYARDSNFCSIFQCIYILNGIIKLFWPLGVAFMNILLGLRTVAISFPLNFSFGARLSNPPHFICESR